MAQPFKAADQEGISTWSLKDLEAHREKMDEESIRALREAQERPKNEAENGERMLVDGDEFGIDDDEEMAMMEVDA